jgi:hypothetical protein
MELGGPVPKLFEARVSDVRRNNLVGLQWVNGISSLKTGRHKTSTLRAFLFRRLTIQLIGFPFE